MVPPSALVDDAGVTVAYVQLEGESFARREVRVAGAAGRRRALVDGLRAGERLVTRGGGAIRRSLAALLGRARRPRPLRAPCSNAIIRASLRHRVGRARGGRVLLVVGGWS